MALSFIRKAETNVVAAGSFLITKMESCSTAQTSLVAFSDTADPAGALSSHLSTSHGHYSAGRCVDSHLHTDVDDRFSVVFCGLRTGPGDQTIRRTLALGRNGYYSGR